MPTRPSRMADPLWMSIGTLTAVPVPAPSVVDRRVARWAMVLAPVAALPVALLAAGVVLGGDVAGLPPLLTASLAVGALGLATRGLHLDGLADTADGLSRASRGGAGQSPASTAGGQEERARALEVMRKGDVGPIGVATLALVLLAQVAALSGAIAAGNGVPTVVAMVVVSRLVLVVCCADGVPAARKEGLGGAVAGSVSRWTAGITLGVGLLVVSLGAVAAGVPWWRGTLAALLGIACAVALLARCVRRLGGITGDVLGGCIEVAALGVAVASAA